MGHQTENRRKQLKWLRHIIRKEDGHIKQKIRQSGILGETNRERPKDNWERTVAKELNRLGVAEDPEPACSGTKIMMFW